MFNLEQLIWLVTLTTINNLLWLEQISLVSIRLLDLFGFDFQGINQELLVFLFFVFFLFGRMGENYFFLACQTLQFSVSFLVCQNEAQLPTTPCIFCSWRIFVEKEAVLACFHVCYVYF